MDIKPGFQMQVGEQAHQKEASFYSYQCCMASKQCNTLGLTSFQLSQSFICFDGLVDLNVFLGSVLSISTILCCDHTGTVGHNIYRLQMSGFLCLCERGGCTEGCNNCFWGYQIWRTTNRARPCLWMGIWLPLVTKWEQSCFCRS
jgi:hypothetical protein